MIVNKNSWNVQAYKKIEYEITSVEDLFNVSNTEILYPNKPQHDHRFVVIDENVFNQFAQKIDTYFRHHKIVAQYCVVESGEDHKTIEQYFRIARELEKFPIHRRDEPIIAIGGGVLTDVAAFVAGTYRRGVPHLKVPTTLMGYVDASIGIKNGINFNEHKNRLGGFEPPSKVFLDREFLNTLPKRHLLNGVAEIIKIAIIKDADLFAKLESCGRVCIESNFQDSPSKEMLNIAITDMLEELEPNLYEEDLARKVDFGHTFSYGLETQHEMHLLHGEAVLLDILLSCQIAFFRGLLSDSDVDRIMNLVRDLGFENKVDLLDTKVLWDSLNERIYHRNGLQRVPLPKKIGNCVFVNDIQRSEIEAARESLTRHSELNYA